VLFALVAALYAGRRVVLVVIAAIERGFARWGGFTGAGNRRSRSSAAVSTGRMA